MTSHSRNHPPVPAEIARAERRRAMLERLTELGMAQAQSITESVLHRPDSPEAPDDPASAFASVARAVRLTLALETMDDELILALRNGIARPTRTPRPSPTLTDGPLGDGDLDEDFLDIEEEDEDEDEEALLSGGIRECMGVICADLGLDPDWSCWSDEEGFIRDDGAPITEWALKPGEGWRR